MKHGRRLDTSSTFSTLSAPFDVIPSAVADIILSFQTRDSGIYECQVNTEPKRSLAFNLHVVGKFSLHVILFGLSIKTPYCSEFSLDVSKRMGRG